MGFSQRRVCSRNRGLHDRQVRSALGWLPERNGNPQGQPRAQTRHAARSIWRHSGKRSVFQSWAMGWGKVLGIAGECLSMWDSSKDGDAAFQFIRYMCYDRNLAWCKDYFIVPVRKADLLDPYYQSELMAPVVVLDDATSTSDGCTTSETRSRMQRSLRRRSRPHARRPTRCRSRSNKHSTALPMPIMPSCPSTEANSSSSWRIRHERG